MPKIFSQGFINKHVKSGPCHEMTDLYIPGITRFSCASFFCTHTVLVSRKKSHTQSVAQSYLARGW